MLKNNAGRVFYLLMNQDKSYSIHSVQTDKCILSKVSSFVALDFLRLNEPSNPSISLLEKGPAYDPDKDWDWWMKNIYGVGEEARKLVEKERNEKMWPRNTKVEPDSTEERLDQVIVKSFLNHLNEGDGHLTNNNEKIMPSDKPEYFTITENYYEDPQVDRLFDSLEEQEANQGFLDPEDYLDLYTTGVRYSINDCYDPYDSSLSNSEYCFWDYDYYYDSSLIVTGDDSKQLELDFPVKGSNSRLHNRNEPSTRYKPSEEMKEVFKILYTDDD